MVPFFVAVFVNRVLQVLYNLFCIFTEMFLPEYASSGYITPEADVYSFGIIILEMITRKKPTDEMFVEGLTLCKWVQAAFPHMVHEVIDPALQVELEQDLCEVLYLLKIGLLCTQKVAKDRPTMKEVLEMLLFKKQELKTIDLSTLIQGTPTYDDLMLRLQEDSSSTDR